MCVFLFWPKVIAQRTRILAAMLTYTQQVITKFVLNLERFTQFYGHLFNERDLKVVVMICVGVNIT